MSKIELTAAERATIASVRSGASMATRMVTTNIPEQHQAVCPKCGGVGHATIIASWGHCLRCQQNG